LKGGEISAKKGPIFRRGKSRPANGQAFPGGKVRVRPPNAPKITGPPQQGPPLRLKHQIYGGGKEGLDHPRKSLSGPKSRPGRKNYEKKRWTIFHGVFFNWEGGRNTGDSPNKQCFGLR